MVGQNKARSREWEGRERVNAKRKRKNEIER